jgi:quercetin dioxygenase-like cupin family protein
MFTKHDPAGFLAALPGIERKTLCHGAKTLLTEFHLAGGSLLPTHAHPHEQTGCLVSGRMRLRIGSEEHDVGPGDSWCIAGGVEHGATIVEDSVAIEVFAPVREDYLPPTAGTACS